MQFCRDPQVVKVSKHRKYDTVKFSVLLKRTSVSENIVEEGLRRLQEPVEVDDYNELIFYVHNTVEPTRQMGR